MDWTWALVVLGLCACHALGYRKGYDEGFNMGVMDTLDTLVDKRFITDDDIELLNKGQSALSRKLENRDDA